jgi:hypothetical protein
MDWYFGSGIDDLLVPKYQELSDRLPSSPDSWSKWGIREPESFKDIGLYVFILWSLYMATDNCKMCKTNVTN